MSSETKDFASSRLKFNLSSVRPTVPSEAVAYVRSLHHVNFFCDAINAQHVFLVGDFNHWDAIATPMERMADRRWMVGLELPQGHHRYVFVVDGDRQLDPKASGVTRNDSNERVSLVAVS